MSNKVYCIGDSHVSVFLGKDKLAPIFPKTEKSLLRNFEVIRLGGVLAYNFGKKGTVTQAREKIEEQILVNIKEGSCLLISAGEIDCRVHLIKQSIMQHHSYEILAKELVKRYFEYLVTLSEKFRICILLPPPTSYLGEDTLDEEYPRYGSEVERNKVTKCVIQELCDQAKLFNIQVIGVKKSISPEFLTNRTILWDGIHLSTRCIPELISQLNENMELNIKISYFWKIREALREIKKLFK